MPGLIEQVLSLGLERREVIKDHPMALIGGARIPYPPKDMASLVSILVQRGYKSYLALEATTDGAVKFLETNLNIPKVLRLPKGINDKELRRLLRTMTEPVDIVSIDCRGLPLDAATIWRYIEGGKDATAKEFGVGAPRDYGIPKLTKNASIIINMAEPGCRDLWFKVRARHSQSFQSPFVGMAYVTTR